MRMIFYENQLCHRLFSKSQKKNKNKKPVSLPPLTLPVYRLGSKIPLGFLSGSVTYSLHHTSATQGLCTFSLSSKLDALKQSEFPFTANILLLTHFAIAVL